MANNTFKPGDRVKLNTGGPVMSVLGSSASRSTWLVCAWFAGKKAMKEDFAPESLVLANDGDDEQDDDE